MCFVSQLYKYPVKPRIYGGGCDIYPDNGNVHPLPGSAVVIHAKGAYAVDNVITIRLQLHLFIVETGFWDAQLTNLMYLIHYGM